MLQEQYTLHLPSGETQTYNMSDIRSDSDDGQELFNVVDTIMHDRSQMVSFPLTPQRRIAGYANDMFKVAKKRKEETSSLREVILQLESELHAGLRDQAANVRAVENRVKDELKGELRAELQDQEVKFDAKLDANLRDLQDNVQVVEYRVHAVERYLTYKSAPDYHAMIRRQIIDGGQECFAIGMYFFLEKFLRRLLQCSDEPLRMHILKTCFGAPPGVIQEFQRNWRRARLPSGGTSSVSVTTSAGTEGESRPDSALSVASHPVSAFSVASLLSEKLRRSRHVQDEDYFLPYVSEKTPYVHATDWALWWEKIVFGDTIKFQSVDQLGNAKGDEVKGLKPDAVSSWKYAMDRFLAIMRGEKEKENVESKDPSPDTVFDTKVFHDAASSICASLKDQLKEEEKTKVFLLHVRFAHGMLEDSVVVFEILAKSNILQEYGSEAVHSVELPLKLDEDRDTAWTQAISETAEADIIPDITTKQKGLMRIFKLMKAENLR
ncbi:hypothetical protein ACEPAH_7348 [Sanghuangporus vaninii]